MLRRLPLPYLAALAAGILIGIWAARTILDRSVDPATESPQQIVVRVAAGTLDRSLTLAGQAEWSIEGTIRAPVGGIVTSLSPAGLFSPGEVALRIDERPVALIPSPIPGFRDLSVGDRGRDVSALQDYLADAGYPVQADHAEYGEATRTAVAAWQRELQLPESGSIQLGDVLFIEPGALTRPLRWAPGIEVGTFLSPGLPLLESVSSQPRLTVQFGGSPPDQIEPGQTGTAVFPDGQSRAVVVDAIASVDGSETASFSSENNALCEIQACGSLVPLTGSATSIDIEIELIPPTTGPIVPVAAVQTDSAGEAFVELADGTRRPITVVVANGGSAVVHGVQPGEQIILP